MLIQQKHVVLREDFSDLCLVLPHDRVMGEKKLGPLHPERCIRLTLEDWPFTSRDDIHDSQPNEVILLGCRK